MCHLSWLKKLSPTHTHPLKPIREFLKPYKLLFFELRVTHKMLNLNCIKIYSIILSVTCHGLRNFAPLIHIPRYPFVNFQNPMSNYCLPSFEYKNNNYYLIIIIVLYSQLYQKIITRCSLYKNLNGMIITLVPREKSRNVACVLNGTEMLSPKATTKKNMLSQTLSRKQLTIICQKKTQNS